MVFFSFLVCFSSLAQERFEYSYQQMGTQIKLIFYFDQKSEADEIADKAFRRIDELNQILSDYEPSSELNRLTRNTKKDFAVSNDLYRILKSSVKISKITKGAFDISTGSLIRLWRETHKTKALPSKSKLNKAKRKMGFEHISFRDPNIVNLNNKGIQLDLGGIGKGYTADQIIKLLNLNGATSALVDMGGDICVSNPPPNRENWALAFSHYNKEGEEIIKKIKLNNAAVATSGDLYQFIEIEGERYSHIINPITGMALRNSIQVTTIAKTATEADAFASAFSVLGIERTRTLKPKLKNIHAFIIESRLKNQKSWSSPKFKSYIDTK